MAWSEERLHRWLATRGRPQGLVGSAMHDAAVLGATRARPVLCADQALEGVHFEAGTAGRAVGRKAAARVLSDLAAAAARPRALVACVAAPPDESERRLRAVLVGLRAEARRHGAALVGGDLAARGGPLAVAVTGFGDAPSDRKPPGRDRARPGDVVLLTGPVGGSLLGRHLRIEPRLAAGERLHRAGARALMDVSDGLARDLGRLAAARGVALEIDTVPLHADARRAARASGRTPLDHALHDGEDHELIATLAPADHARVARSLARIVPGACVIGRVVRGRGLRLPDGHGGSVRWDGRGGFVHGDP